MPLDWKSPNSEKAKRQLIETDWDTVLTHTYLWYEIGNVVLLTKDEEKLIIKEFFPDGKAGFGDIELHRGEQIPGTPVLLRLRGDLRLKPSLTLRGRYCPLYQIGHGGMPSVRPSKDSANFMLAL
jgi:hypothetical protein